MAGLNHDFLVIDAGTFSLDKYAEYEASEHVALHDDILCYMADTLAWIPSSNPCKDEDHAGLCWYGPTIIGEEGAQAARVILNGWREIFAMGPDMLVLTGSFVFPSDASPENGKYDVLRFKKREVVGALARIIGFCEIVTQSSGRKCLLHLGI